MSAIYTALTAFSAAMMDIWGEVIEFITTSGNEITLLGVFAWLFVLGVGSIRRLITGV